ncbi:MULTISPECIES: ABC transporter ATP-binding protein [Chryseobacterium]|uniref:ATP-binding cassette subfamily B protein IrtB n=1 Tax=Chryseobacterium camelliae TaxID=1265445 RepID=A0ABU0TJB1_9FLAO|nr:MULTISPECIES: ABC transporter ATP-binding protein [Chryseobacterium]MDT3409237.1 ATP-binding cassette subfamily B protein IrtB [Pseudacidovorax intermedius]MDQ1096901.1 ATP-binding cassette subfamily B protein IrtB [Chryseobacterium camelliae]MDQ1100843.1 ATP-binding cassette subfamily B protein IrtB [Chryseobacterium sp. SORGH_AS_1048]MDR6084285.1 ATP-binding cassette subfamily B protein IrtB [Chryseobacterium sp. SORGH_AS_0909]MDR6132556.1 ATP-binding cassette subfamily B protein IrtB [Ch
MIQNLKYVTSFNRKETWKVIFWSIFHSIFVAMPSGILLIVVWELFSEHPNTSVIWTVVGVMAVMLVIQFYIASKSMVLSNLWVYDLSTRLRIMLGNRIQKFSLGFFKKKDPGEIASIILQDVANFEGIFGHSMGNLASAAFGTVVLSVFLLLYDWRLALCLLAVLPLIYPFLALANYFIQKLGRKQIAARNTMGAKFLEYVQGIRHLKSYGLTGEKHQGLEHAFEEVRRKSITMEAIAGPFVMTASIIFEIGFLAMAALGLYYLNGHSITIPVLITFLIMGYNLYQPLKIVLVDYIVLRYMNESLDRVIHVMHEQTMETCRHEMPSRFDIVFHDVSFGYLDAMTVRNLDFTVPEKSMLALVGHSGSGKTTVASLIARFWDVSSGSITIGGVDIRNINQDHFYGLISEVFQEVYLFDDTIYNNIKIGKPDATRQEILDAADRARVLDFVWELPEGMNTTVGEGGSRLSGGQKQRISIARALLKDAPIVLLDEATASLDPENEVYIQQAIQELVQSKTVVVIAHKLATIRNADQILVLKEGKTAEQGTHNELMEFNGIYRNMWNIQQQSGGWKI